MTSKLIYIYFGIICIFLTNCVTVDPIEGQTSFSIENMTKEYIKILYTYGENVGSLSGTSDYIVIDPNMTSVLDIFRGGDPTHKPSYIYGRIIFISSQNDTLYNMSNINNDEWILTDSIKDYGGYQVGYYHWLYKFK